MLAKNSDEEQMRTSSRKWKEKGELKKEMNRKWLRRGGEKWPQKLGIKTECDNEDEVKPITVAKKKKNYNNWRKNAGSLLHPPQCTARHQHRKVQIEGDSNST